MINRFDFWEKWLFSVSIVIIAFGTFMALCNQTPLFAIFNNQIIHFEGFVSGGFGISGTEVIPRDYRNEPFTNAASLTFLLPELGARFFITKWLAVHFSYRNHLVLDKFEASPRNETKADIAKEKADSRLIANMMFNMGVSFFFPMDFKYTTFR